MDNELGIQKVPGGHMFYKDYNGEIDDWQLDSGFHNGPGCMHCHQTFCHHCNEGIYTEQCTAGLIVIQESALRKVIDVSESSVSG